MQMFTALAVAALLGTGILSPAGAAAAPYRIVDRIAGPHGSWDYVRVDPVRDRLLVAHGTALMLVDLSTGKVTANFAPGLRLHDALPINGGAEILVTNGGSNAVVFADASTGTIIARLPVGKGPDAAATDPKSGLVLVMNHAGGTVSLVDPVAHTLVATIDVGGKLEAAVVTPDGKAYVNVEDRNETAVIDLARRTVIARYPLAGCDGPTGLAYDPRDNVLIAACDGSTVIFAGRDGKILASLPTGAGADGVAFDAAQRLAFVPAGGDGTLAIVAVDGARSKIVQTLKTQPSARTIAFDPRTGRIYLPAARFGPAAAGERPPMLPGSFEVLVIGK